MAHPFGEMLVQYRVRRRGLTQAKLAQLVGYDPALITRMCQGQRDLTGPSGRDRVVRIINVLNDEGALTTLDEANALLAAANMPPLYRGLPGELALIRKLRVDSKALLPAQLVQPRTNLPAPLTSFIGREKELDALIAHARAKRLITLAGVGGCGKTRLAIELAERLLDAFEDGAWWIELAPLQDGAFVPQAVANTLKVREIPGQPLNDTLIRHMRDKRLLLALDNCEHLLNACAGFIETALLACRQLMIVTTSREALDLAGEVVWLVSPLSVPGQNVSSPDQLLEGSESVRLLCDRISSVESAFTLTAENASAVAQICRQLEGIPLALELAASWAKHLSVEQIAARLDDRFGFLTTQRRTALARHQTLRAAMDWSYDQLDDDERAMFRGISVFAGGWDQEGARRVAGYDEKTALDLLSRLADKSLVVATHENGQPRFHMLETIREYALDALRIEGMLAEASARHRHLDYYLALAETPWPKLPDEQSVRLDRLEAEHDNFRTAMNWALTQGNSDAALRLVWALNQFWERRHHFREAREAVAKALAISHPTERTLARARVLSLNSQGWFNENYLEARPLLEEALQIGMEVSDQEFVAYSLFTLGCNAFHRKDFPSELAYFHKSLHVWQELGDQVGICGQMAFLGCGYFDNGDFERARLLLEEALQLADEIGAETEKPRAMIWLGQAILSQGDLAKAESLLHEGLALDRAIGMPFSLVYAIEPLINLAMAQGRMDRAVRLLGARAAVVEAADMGPAGAEWAEAEGHLEAARQRLDEAVFAAAWIEGRAMTQEQALDYALTMS